MIPGLGLIRRTVTLALCGAAFWAGVEFAQAGQAGACRDAGGAWDARGFCVGAGP
jgi:hypothetical protein